MHEKINNTDIAIQVFDNEAESILGLKKKITSDFSKSVDLIMSSAGNVIISGVGKSAIIAQKIVATLNSTGTTSIFMHAADAIHGDLGVVGKNDIVVIVSKSGETPEIKMLVPLIKIRSNKIIAIVGNVDSYLAAQADCVLDVSVGDEADPNSLAPTSSTTAQLAMGDALAVALIKNRGFSADDFAKSHPGGALGKRLYLRVADLYVRNPKPAVGPSDDLAKVIIEISEKRLGATAVLENGTVVGIITDGDLRRMLLRHPDINKVKASDIMTSNPKCITAEALVVDALNIMRQNSITQLPVVGDGNYLGVIHLHDILKEGVI